MKKLAILIVLCASSCFAQVQLGKNVQVGSATASGGALNPGLQTQIVQYPTNGSTGGPTSITTDAATGKNLIVPRIFTGQITNGWLNVDTYANGSGNNGVSNAISSSDCIGAGCLLNRSQTSTDTESIPTALFNAGEYTHVLDSQYGIAEHYFYNAGINTVGSNGNRDVNPSLCWWNDQPAFPTAKYRCNSKYTMYMDPGLYISGSPTGVSSTNDTMNAYGRSISQLHLGTLNAFHVGDAALIYDYFRYRGGAIASNDEADEALVLNTEEAAPPYGTIYVTAPNATLLHTSMTSGTGDGYMLIDIQAPVSSGLITAQTPGSGRLLNSVTTSDTHAVSTGYGTLSGACGAASARNNPITATCNITVISGSFSAAANDPVCIGDWTGQPEQVAVSAVGPSTITMGMTFAHVSGTPIYQGGGCGLKLAPGNGASTPIDANHNLGSYWIAGSKTTTSYDTIVVYLGGQDGNIPVPLPTMPVINLGTMTRTGGVVSASFPVGGNVAFNYNLYTAPNASAITISGATPSDLNGTVTGTTFNPVTGLLSWNQAGADESGSGGSISVVGLNNYFAYCGAETVRVLGSYLTSSGGLGLTGDLQVEPNNCPWTAGDAVIQSNSTAVNFIGTRLGNGALTKPLAGPNVGNVLTLGGAGNSGAIENQVVQGDALNKMVGYGGSTQPHTYLSSASFYQTTFNFAYAPLYGGSLFNIGCPPEGCGPNNYTYSLFQLSGYTPTGNKGSQFTFNPANSTFGMNSSLIDDLSVSGKTAVGVSASGQTPGTSGYGGWFASLAVNPGDTYKFNTLVLGNGLPVDSSGTLGANNLIAPQIVTGAPAPANFTVFNIGTAGTTTYTYACTAVTANGETPAGTGTTTTGNATLSSSNSNQPKCFGVPGAQSLNIYRTAGGATTGKIANIPNGNGTSDATRFLDTGLPGDGTSPPVTNTTGKFTVYGPADGCATITASVLGSTGSPCGSGSPGVSSIDTLTGAFTFTGPGVSHTGNAYTFNGSGYTLPQATTTVLGGVKCDGTTITCTSGVIAAVAGGTGTVTHTGSLTAGFVMLGNGTADSKVSTSLDDGITTANTITSTEPIAVKCTSSSCPSQVGLTYNSLAAPTVGSSTTAVYAVNASGQAETSEAGAAFSRICTAANGVCSGGIANTTTTVGTTAIAANTCTSATTVTMTGVATTSVFDFTPNADVSGTTGWGTTGGLTIVAWPTLNTLNYKTCNQTASSITPSASVTFNVGAR
jgi:hypothetical protein